MPIDHDAAAAAVEYATLAFERLVGAPVDQVFDAFADARLRAAWGAPTGTAVVIYDAADFREGGEDRFRCGPRERPDIHATTRYLDIVPGRRIVSSQTVEHGGRRLCASLTTVELTPERGGTRLRSTVQVASFAGAGMVQGHEAGHAGSLDGLVRYFDAAREARST